MIYYNIIFYIDKIIYNIIPTIISYTVYLQGVLPPINRVPLVVGNNYVIKDFSNTFFLQIVDLKLMIHWAYSRLQKITTRERMLTSDYLNQIMNLSYDENIIVEVVEVTTFFFKKKLLLLRKYQQFYNALDMSL